jgi:3-isopropylmalate/(R)-2-methylmalate dehydratase small subunit
MRPFTTHLGVAAPLIRPNIDTDAIIPSREMTGVSKTGLADGLFAGWRYAEIGGRSPNPDFVLNDPAYRGASILLAGENFGCGSSREHAVWALAEYGFRAVIAPSFSPIFENNCVGNGMLPARAAARFIDHLAARVAPDAQTARVLIDLPGQRIVAPDGLESRFDLAEEAKERLIEGLDPIAVTLKMAADIRAFRERDRQVRPWAYLDVPQR